MTRQEHINRINKQTRKSIARGPTVEFFKVCDSILDESGSGFEREEYDSKRIRILEALLDYKKLLGE